MYQGWSSLGVAGIIHHFRRLPKPSSFLVGSLVRVFGELAKELYFEKTSMELLAIFFQAIEQRRYQLREVTSKEGSHMLSLQQ